MYAIYLLRQSLIIWGSVLSFLLRCLCFILSFSMVRDIRAGEGCRWGRGSVKHAIMLLSSSQKSLGMKGDVALTLSLRLTDDFCLISCLGQGSTVGGIQPAEKNCRRVESRLHLFPDVWPCWLTLETSVSLFGKWGKSFTLVPGPE